MVHLFPYFCFEFTPGGLVDTVVPHFLVLVHLIECLENALRAIGGSIFRCKYLEKGGQDYATHILYWKKQ